MSTDIDLSESWDDWDDIQLTPVGAPADVPSRPAKNTASVDGNQIKTLSDNISTAFKELDDSFMYLGVLKKLPLPDATRFFENRFPDILLLFEKVWKNETYPEKEVVFSIAGEDFSELNKLIHSGDAIQPIYEGLKTVYENVEEFKNSGMSQPDSLETLKDIFASRK